MMKLLFISQWCYPEPDARIFVMAKELVKVGHSVQILTGFPNYPGGKIYQGYRLKLFQRELISGVEVIRVWLFPSHDRSSIKRIINYISFAISSSILGLLLTKKADLIYVYHPPATSGIPALILGKIYRAKIVYDIQDLWPDSITSSGMIKGKFTIGLIDLFQKYIYKNSTAITVISEGFKKVLISRGVYEGKIQVIKNWSIPMGEEELEKDEIPVFSRRFVLLYAGNLGKAQSLKTVIDAAKIVKERNINDILFAFLGSGPSKDEIISYSESYKLNNVLFLNRISPEKVGSILKMADVLLIHLANNPLFKITIPSKTQSYMMIGKPILAGIEGDAAQIINEAGAGYTFAPENPSQLVEQLLSLKKLTKDELEYMGLKGKIYYNNYLAINKGVSKFESLFLKLTNQ